MLTPGLAPRILHEGHPLPTAVTREGAVSRGRASLLLTKAMHEDLVTCEVLNDALATPLTTETKLDVICE